ncbi:hypothetical protein EDB85DRAFT_2158170 [Lactarius pseudohatsudake]|nr:hypothetical protein EDB85DRAFT_2158170 [Lactarius pseudohatsudake]
MPSSQAAPEAASESETDTEEDESEEDHLSNVNPEEQEELARLTAAVTIRERPNVPAESSSLPEPEDIYIHEPEDMATATIAEARTEEQPLLPINLNTGHRAEQPAPRPPPGRHDYLNPYTRERYTEEDLALHRAVGPDQDDPPSGGGRRGGWPPDDGLPGGGGGPPRGPRGGGFGGGGPLAGFGGGPPGGWPPVGGLPIGPAAPPVGGNGKFIGQPPEVFTRDRTKTEEFLTQWELYWGVNNNNTVMSNPYQRAMIFLTYIRGSRVNEWLVAISRWLNRQVSQERVLDANPWLWTQVLIAFNRRFADTLEKERAQATLKKGIKMRDGDIDAYVTLFENLTRQAGYRPDSSLTLDFFTNGLPKELFEKCYQWDSPRTYEDWKRSVLHRQEQWIHMKARQQAFSSNPGTPSRRNSGPPPPPYQGRSGGWMPPRGPPPDPNAMDTSAGRTRGRLAGSEDINPNAQRPPPYHDATPTTTPTCPDATPNAMRKTHHDATRSLQAPPWRHQNIARKNLPTHRNDTPTQRRPTCLVYAPPRGHPLHIDDKDDGSEDQDTNTDNTSTNDTDDTDDDSMTRGEQVSLVTTVALRSFCDKIILPIATALNATQQGRPTREPHLSTPPANASRLSLTRPVSHCHLTALASAPSQGELVAQH